METVVSDGRRRRSGGKNGGSGQLGMMESDNIYIYIYELII